MLTLTYFGLRGLPAGLENVRLEYPARALRRLARQPGIDPHRVVVNGYSRDGELALILGRLPAACPRRHRRTGRARS